MIRDPPFSRIDLISCRNLLIYLDKELQHQLVPVFHYALRSGGYLFLGSSETLMQHGDLFAPVDKRHRIFQRRDHPPVHPALPLLVPAGRAGVPEPRPFHNHATLPLRHVVETRLLDRFAPAHVVVTRDGDVVHFSTRTGKYLEHAPGAPTRNIVALARRGLRLELRGALSEAVENRRAVHRGGARVEIDDRIQIIDIAIEPLLDHDIEPLFLIVFSDVGGPLSPEQLLPGASDHLAATEQLETELRDSRERLQSMVEEYETALEELKSANEELVSINEELQSTNEELETSREESQSINEELNTVNSELQHKIEQLDRVNDNLRNLFEGTEVATVLLDRNLVVRSFTPAIKSIFNLMDIDQGRRLTDIVSEIADLDVQHEIEPALTTGQGHERQVMRRDGTAQYLMRVLPYRTADRTIDGALLTFTDITRIVEIEEFDRELRQRIETLIQLVLGVARHSLPDDTAAAALRRRLQAVAATYGLVARAGQGAVGLAEVAARQLAPYGTGGDGRAVVEGPEVWLEAKAAVVLGLALHELATGAATHGALSVPQGRVHLGWQVEPDDGEPRLVIRWRESGGPATALPDSGGYGDELIVTMLREQIGGTGEIRLGAGGIEGEIAVPLSSGIEPVAAPAAGEKTNP